MTDIELLRLVAEKEKNRKLVLIDILEGVQEKQLCMLYRSELLKCKKKELIFMALCSHK